MTSLLLILLTVLNIFLQVASGAASTNSLCNDIKLLNCSSDTPRQICGSNGITYPTSCDYAKAHCADDTITIANEGACPVTVQPDPICLTLINEDCPNVTNLVCASDLFTYNNFCEFEKSKCKSPSLSLVSLGWCPSPTTTVPPTTQSIFEIICANLENQLCPTAGPQVCGSDGITYGSGCDLEKANCNSVSSITLVKEGPC